MMMVLLLVAMVAAAYVYGVGVGRRWGRAKIDAAYQCGRDDSIRYLMQ